MEREKVVAYLYVAVLVPIRKDGVRAEPQRKAGLEKRCNWETMKNHSYNYYGLRSFIASQQ